MLDAVLAGLVLAFALIGVAATGLVAIHAIVKLIERIIYDQR
jgi:hypothetical protein